MAKTSTSRVRLPFQRAPGGQGAEEVQPADADGREQRSGSGAGGALASAGGRRRMPVSGETAFYVVVGAVLVAYTVTAFGMEWQTTAGRVGAGLFPRIIGVLGVAICLFAALRSALRRPDAPESEPAGGTAESYGATSDATARAAEAAPSEGGEAGAGTAEQADQSPAVPEKETRHPWTVAALCLILAAFVTVMVPVGAVITGSLALIAALLLCDRSHPLRSLALGVAFPVLLYVVFVMGLNAPLPPGILPFY